MALQANKQSTPETNRRVIDQIKHDLGTLDKDVADILGMVGNGALSARKELIQAGDDLREKYHKLTTTLDRLDAAGEEVTESLVEGLTLIYEDVQATLGKTRKDIEAVTKDGTAR